MNSDNNLSRFQWNKDKTWLLLLLIFFTVSQLKFLHIDFWNDEIYTFKNFVFVPVSAIVTDYHVPNNHIFFNLLIKVYLSLAGITSLFPLLDHPFVLRIFLFLISLGSIVVTYLIAKRMFNSQVAILSALVLITTIPFYNFALQARGYGLSILLDMLILYCCVTFDRKRAFTNLILVFFLCVLSVYTIPLNIYFIASLIVFISFDLLITKIRSRGEDGTEWKSKLKLHNALTAGLIAGVCLYLPVFKEAFYNEDVKSYDLFYFDLLKNIPVIFSYFLSARWLLLLVFLAGMYFLFKNNSAKAEKKNLLLLSIILLVPFVISFVRGDHAPQRAFVNLVPVFSILLAAGIYYGWQQFTSPRTALFILSAYCLGVFILQVGKVRTHLLKDLVNGGRSHNIYYNYYLDHFEPLYTAKTFTEKYYHPGTAVMVNDCEPHDFYNYLDLFSIPYLPADKLDSLIATEKNFYVVTRYPFLFAKQIEENYPGRTSAMTSSRLLYHNFVLVYYRK